MIIKLEESLSSEGGYVVYFDDAHPFHWFEGMRKSPRSITVGQQIKDYLKDKQAVSKKEVKAAIDAENEANLERFKAQQAARREKREASRADQYEALIKRLSKDLKK